jgi:hypothetical protein
VSATSGKKVENQEKKNEEKVKVETRKRSKALGFSVGILGIGF